MTRYFTRPRTLYVADEPDWDSPAQSHLPTVSDHTATDTGLLDEHGDAIMRAPNPIGYIWSDQ